MKKLLLQILIFAGIMGCSSNTNDKPLPPASSSAQTSGTKPVSASTNPEVLTDGYHLLGEWPENILVGRFEGRRDTLIPVKEEGENCYRILLEKDFDGNGWPDVLVENVRACGGNGAGNSYFFASYGPDQGFLVTEEYGYAWETPQIDSAGTEVIVSITSQNEGANQMDIEKVVEKIVLREGQAVLIEKAKVPEKPALKEMRAKQFDGNKMDEKRTLIYDLDNDGRTDTLMGILGQRWGRISWSINFGDGRGIERGSPACKRIGVLSSTTNGVHDLVCDLDEILQWDGEEFVVLGND